MRRRLVALIASLLGHALMLAPAILGGTQPKVVIPALRPGTAPVVEAAEAAARVVRAREARRALVERARADLRAGSLHLGAFLLAANQIDVEERGESLDMVEAEARYAERLSALRAALERDDLPHAVPAVFGDLRYHGEPGGLVARALLEGGGSCEPVAELIAAAAHDAGRSAEVALRYYGGPMDDGIGHLSAVALQGAEEIDLLSGRPAVKTGARFAAADLVEAYARAHDLAPPLPEPAKPGGGGGGEAAGGSAGRDEPARPTTDRPTLALGFPPNADRYPGRLPLYAARAVKEPGDSAEAIEEPVDARERASHCGYFVRMVTLYPPEVTVDLAASGDDGALSFEPWRMPNPQRLEREAELLAGAEEVAAQPDADAADRLMAWACLSAVGEVAAVDFTLAGERRFAEMALAKRRAAREEAKKALAAIPWSSPMGERVRKRMALQFGGQTWLLLRLQGGEEVVLALSRGTDREDWGQVSARAALLLWPGTRARALELLATLPKQEQVDVMHEVFHAHDHARPWATNVDLPGDPSQEFLRVYGVFRGLAFRLWEAQREAGEVLEALHREARAAGIDPAWEAALIEYAARNLLGLHSNRPNGLAVVLALRDAVRASGHPSLDLLRRQLDYIVSQSRLDARTLADAMRMQ
jgi:hypothetical protein